MDRTYVVWALLLATVAVGCGETDASVSASAPDTGRPQTTTLNVAPQNSDLLVGTDRISIALLDQRKSPVSGVRATVDIQSSNGAVVTRPLENIGSEYGGIPIYVGTASFPQPGAYRYTVHATLADGTSASGQATVLATPTSKELAVGAKVPALRQPIASDPGVKISDIDSGVPPDPWHTATIADGLAQHRPMILYFGEPGFCKSKTCGPTVAVLQKLVQQVGDRFLVEHVEDHYPAGPDETSKDNPVFDAFGLATDPWIYFVNSEGVVADRFEGPVTVGELTTAAVGTLAGRVPAVNVATGG